MKFNRLAILAFIAAVTASCVQSPEEENGSQWIRINEIDPSSDCIELYNSGENAVSLDGFKLRRLRMKDSQQDKQTLWLGTSSVKIAPGEYLVLRYEEGKTDNAIYPTNLQNPISSKKNIHLWLQDAREMKICQFERGQKSLGWGEVRMFKSEDADENSLSFSLVNDEWALATPTIGTGNGAKLGDIDQTLLTVSINEISLSTGKIELYNYGDKAVDISGFELRWARFKSGVADNQTIWTASSGTKISAGAFYTANVNITLSGYNAKNIHLALRDPSSQDSLGNIIKWDDFKRGEKGNGWTKDEISATSASYVRIPDGTGQWYLAAGGVGSMGSANGSDTSAGLVPQVQQPL